MFSGLDILFHPRHDPVYLFAYSTTCTIDLSLFWIFFFLENWVLENYFGKSSRPPHIKKSNGRSLSNSGMFA